MINVRDKGYFHFYLFIILKPKSRQCGVGAHQRQGKREEGNKSEKSEEKERHRGTEDETLYPHPRQLMRTWGRRAERKKKQGVGPQPSYPGPFGVASYDPHGSYSNFPYINKL